ncbi:hypothetical protein JCM33374_g4609 [Metschnikowia sp. JCM 33374]|nr:hypothetical protein JCM33374_g4609 [Metschnikowia sp. JCM 33374]
MASRKAITTNQRIILRQYARENQDIRQSELREWFEMEFGQKISQSSISESLSSKFSSLDNTEDVRQPESKRRRVSQYPELEEALYKWLKESQTQPLGLLSDSKLREHAVRIWGQLYPEKEVPTFSTGWAFGFRKRCGIIHQRFGGYVTKTNRLIIVDQPEVIDALVKEYPRGDIYSCEQTRLFWKHTPDHTLDENPASAAPEETPNGKRAISSAHISTLLCCNGDATDKLVPWVVGHVTRPRCFDAANVQPHALACRWKAGPDASPTVDTMKEWFVDFDAHVAQRGRKVILIMQDLGPARAAVQVLTQLLMLKKLTVCFVSSDPAAQIRPFQHGLLSCFKAYYRRRWLQYMVDEYDQGRQPEQTMNVLKAIRWVRWAWSEVSHGIIAVSWHAAGLAKPPVALGQDASANKGAEAAAMAEITALVSELFQKGRINSILPIENFVNPQGENVHAAGPDEGISNVSEKDGDKEDCYEIGELVEKISVITQKEALAHIEALFLYEEQQKDGTGKGIEILSKYESYVSQRCHKELQ